MEKKKRIRKQKPNARRISANWKYSDRAVSNATQMVYNTVSLLEKSRGEYVISTRVKEFPSAFIDYIFLNNLDQLAVMCKDWAEKSVQTDVLENLPHYRKSAILAKSENLQQ